MTVFSTELRATASTRTRIALNLHTAVVCLAMYACSACERGNAVAQYDCPCHAMPLFWLLDVLCGRRIILRWYYTFMNSIQSVSVWDWVIYSPVQVGPRIRLFTKTLETYLSVYTTVQYSSSRSQMRRPVKSVRVGRAIFSRMQTKGLYFLIQ